MGMFREWLAIRESGMREPGFEANIKDNPLDPNVRLVYADWLDEHDDPKEAAFQRSIAYWLQRYAEVGQSPYNPEYVRWRPWFFRISYPPKGVDVDNMECFYGNRDAIIDGRPGDEGQPDDHGEMFQRKMHYKTFEDMLNAFRKHFDPSKAV